MAEKVKRVCSKCQQPSEKFEFGLCPPCKQAFDDWEKGGLKQPLSSSIRERRKRRGEDSP